jgi:tetratricopeptide (TPR) repeat protein
MRVGMHVASRLRAAVLAAAALFLCGAPARMARADPPAPPAAPPAAVAPTEAQFLASLDRSRVLLGAGDAKGGQKTLDEALALHGEQDYVRAKRADLEDLAKRLAFRMDCPPPDPATLVKGTLKKFVSRTGELEIRYAAGKGHDFETSGSGALAFPARFQGPFTITVKGDAYPSRSSPHVQVGLVNDPKTNRTQIWGVVPGFPSYTEGRTEHWLPARIVWMDGDSRKVVSEKATSPAKPGAAWRLKVQVTRGKVLGFINDSSLGYANKPDTVFGYALIEAVDWSEIIVEGQIEPSWLQGRIDKIVEGKRAAFEAKFDIRSRLPAWLFRKADPSKAVPEPSLLDEDDKVPEKFRIQVLHVRMLLLTDRDEEALVQVERLRAAGAPESLVWALSARANLGLGEATKALADAERLLAAEPESHEAIQLKAEVLARLGREEEAAALWDAAAAKPGAGVDFYVAGSMQMLLAGRLDTARKLSERAARLGLRSPLLDSLGRVLAQATNGPTWPKTYEYKTTNYHVTSDIDVDTCMKASNVLEEALQIYREQVHALKPEKRRAYKVFLFSGKEGFLRYLADVSVLRAPPMENVAGLYSPLLKQLLIWNLPSRAEMMRTVRHEGFHQYLDRVLPDPPVWFNEGMAVYYEGMERVGGDLKIGRPRPDDVAFLEKERLKPLREFLPMTSSQFYKGGHHSYAQAWLLVHMLKHGSSKHRDLYKSLMTRLETTAGRDATREVFPDAILSALDGDLAAHRLTLSRGK